jgi:hypothetical protein
MVKMMQKIKSKPRFVDAYQSDSGVETIDLSKLVTITSEADDELIELNRRVRIEHPKDGWVLFPTESGEPRLLFDKSKWHEPPSYKNLGGQRITPTRIISLLTQNLSGTSRPASTFFWWKQTDEGYYIARAKEGLAEFVAETRENYYLVGENSKHRLKFRCPKIGKSDKKHGRLGDCDDDCDGDDCRHDDYDDYLDDTDFNEYGVSWVNYPVMREVGPILIHIDPHSDQARWICPRCSKANSKKYRGDGRAVMHNVPRDLRDLLAKEGIIPPKEYKYKDRLAEAPKLLNLITKNPGMSFYELDHAMGWDSDGKNSERIINKHLKDRVELRKGRKEHKGYKVYIKH